MDDGGWIGISVVRGVFSVLLPFTRLARVAGPRCRSELFAGPSRTSRVEVVGIVAAFAVSATQVKAAKRNSSRCIDCPPASYDITSVDQLQNLHVRLLRIVISDLS